MSDISIARMIADLAAGEPSTTVLGGCAACAGLGVVEVVDLDGIVLQPCPELHLDLPPVGLVDRILESIRGAA